MKVLFAMGLSQKSKIISERYYDKFGETLEYKDIFYFKALLDEVKRDKSYNVIVINEDLEQYKAKDIEQIDRKLFSYVDSVTDEAQDADIIYICSDRRSKDDQFIVRLYSIGIYNILLGDDRNVNSLCEVIKRPKTKREAKEYLNIDSSSINETGIMRDDEVDETQMMNILNYYEKIKDQPDKYVETFESIEKQYSHAQLKVIASWLPKNVQEVIYEVPKYKFLLSFDGREKTQTSTDFKNVQNVKKVEKKQSQNFFGVFKKSKEKLIKNMGHKNTKVQSVEQEDMDKELAEKAKIEMEAKKQQELQEQAIKEAEAKKQQELQEQAIKEAEAKKQQELQEQAIKEAEAKKQQELQQQLNRELEIKAQEEQIIVDVAEVKVDEQQKLTEQLNKELQIKAQEEQIIVDVAEVKVDEQQKLEEQLNKELQVKAQEEQIIVDVAEVKVDEQQKLAEQAKKEAELKRQQELAEQAKKEAELKRQQELAEQAKREAELKRQQELAEQAKREAELKRQQDLAEQAKREAELKRQQDLAEQAKREAELKRQQENQINEQNTNQITSNVLSDEQRKFEEEQERLAIEQEKIKKVQAELEEEKRKLREEQERLIKEKNQIETIPTITETKATYEMATVTPINYKKIVVFVGANKAGTTFMVNAVAHNLVNQKVLTSILDMTKDKSMYYIYNQGDKTLRNIAKECMQKITDGEDYYIPVSKHLKVYTTVPGGLADSRRGYKHKAIIETVKNNSNVVIVDADFTTPIDYFENASEIYIVQDMDILKMQETTMFLREMKNRNVDMSKIKIIINKYVKNMLTPKKIIESLCYYKDPEMTFIDTVLNNKVPYGVVPYNLNNYTKYIESLCRGTMNFKGYSIDFIEAINEITSQIYSKGGDYKKRKGGLFG